MDRRPLPGKRAGMIALSVSLLRELVTLRRGGSERRTSPTSRRLPASMDRESEEHRQCKIAIYERLVEDPRVSNARWNGILVRSGPI